MHPIFRIILYALLGTIFFYVGFIIGSIIDAIFYRIYTKTDPREKNTGAIIGIVSVQIFVLIVIQVIVNRIPAPRGYEMIHSLFDLGYIISQFYMAHFAMEKISNLIYDRKKSARTSLLERLPGVGKFFENTHEDHVIQKEIQQEEAEKMRSLLNS
jgi:hypothetical protein